MTEKAGGLGIAIQLTDVVAKRVVGDRTYAPSVGDAAALLELARTLEPHFSRLWLTDNFGYRSTTTLLGALAASTSLDLGTFTSFPYGRNPVDVAASLATVQELMGEERDLAFGLSRGSRLVTDLHLGDRPRHLLGEYITVLRALLAGETVAVDDHPELARTHALQAGGRMVLHTDPVDIPLLVASTGPRTLRLAGEAADGVLFVTQQPNQSAGTLASPEFARVSGFDEVQAARASQSRPFRQVYGISISVAPDPADALDFARRQVAGVLATKRDEQLIEVGIDPDVARAVRAALDGSGGLAEASRQVPADVVRRLIATGTPAEVASQVTDAVERARQWGFDEHFLCFPLGPDLKGAVETILGGVLPELRTGALL